jgi:hypothetical protein
MNRNEDKNMQEFVEKIMKKAPLESPSFDFTAAVMAKVSAIEKSKATIYKPAISKKGWFLIFGGLFATMAYFIFSVKTQNAGHFGTFGPRVRDFLKSFNGVHLFQFPGITANVIIVATVMIFIQIAFLKNHINKRFQK